MNDPGRTEKRASKPTVSARITYRPTLAWWYRGHDVPLQQGLWIRSEGVKLMFESDVLTQVILFSDKDQGCTQFSGPLPRGMAFSDTIQQVRAKLGRPTQSDTDVDGLTFDKWRYREFSLWVKYNSDKKVLRIHMRSPWKDVPLP
jgi:hypothetical protein